MTPYVIPGNPGSDVGKLPIPGNKNTGPGMETRLVAKPNDEENTLDPAVGISSLDVLFFLNYLVMVVNFLEM